MRLNTTTPRATDPVWRAKAASAERSLLGDDGTPGGTRPTGAGTDLSSSSDGGGSGRSPADAITVRPAALAAEGTAAPETAVVATFRERFAETAGDPSEFHALLEKTFGPGYDRAAAEGIRQQALAGDFSWLPRIEVVDAASLADLSGTQGAGEALGAYDGASDRILLTTELLAGDPARALDILTEEVGHALDTRLNATDTVGDEGELFARLSSGEPVSEAEVASIRADDDRGVVLVDGKETVVEYGWFSRARKAVSRAVRDVGDAVGGVVRGAGDLVTDGVDSLNGRVITPVLEKLGPAGEFVNDRLVQPQLEFFKGSVDIVVNTAETVVDIGTELNAGLVDFTGNLLVGDLRGAWDSGRGTVRNVGREAAGWVIETTALTLHATGTFLDGTFGLSEVRGLNAEEREHLESIYGDSLDYGSIRIHRGGIKDALDLDSQAVGNDIYLKDGAFEADGTLTENGLDLLAHEAAHSWQFQNGGAGYISAALVSYVDDRDAAYDYVTALDELTPWDDLTPDHQAEFAKIIGMAKDAPSGPDLNRDSLTEAIQEETGDMTFGRVSVDQLAYMVGIRDRLLAGEA